MLDPRASLANQTAITSTNVTADQRKSTEAWQLACWVRWAKEEDWPGKLDLYEAAAYLRVSPASIRRATEVDRAGRAELPHQRIGAAYRFSRRDLDCHGRVEGR